MRQDIVTQAHWPMVERFESAILTAKRYDLNRLVTGGQRGLSTSNPVILWPNFSRLTPKTVADGGVKICRVHVSQLVVTQLWEPRACRAKFVIGHRYKSEEEAACCFRDSRWSVEHG